MYDNYPLLCYLIFNVILIQNSERDEIFKEYILDCNASSILHQNRKMQLLDVRFWWTTKMSTYMTTIKIFTTIKN